MAPKRYILITVTAGILCGLITAFTFFNHSWSSIFLWGCSALLVTYFSPDKKSAAIGGAFFGFLTIATWIAAAFRGTPDKIPQLMILIAISGAIAAIAGAIGSFIFYLLLDKFRHKKNSSNISES
jgi:hypothetical protein